MFTQVRLRNFKGFRSDEWQSVDLRRLSVFIGPNGTGKSSILQSLLVLKQSRGSNRLVIAGGGPISLGTVSDVTGNGENASPSGLGFTVRVPMRLPGIGIEHETVIEASSEAHFTSENASYEISAGQIRISSHRVAGERGVDPKEITIEQARAELRPTDILPSLMHAPGRSGNPSQEFNRDLEILLELAANELGTMHFVPAIRGFAEARYPLEADSLPDVGASIDAKANAAGLATTLAYNRELRLGISSALEKITGAPLDQQLVEQRLTGPVSQRPTVGGPPREIVLTNEGFGTNQLTHLLAQVLLTPKRGTVLIEEPELHLHPRAQARLGMWLADHSVSDDKQIVLTTHSEHLLGALL